MCPFIEHDVEIARSAIAGAVAGGGGKVAFPTWPREIIGRKHGNSDKASSRQVSITESNGQAAERRRGV